MIIYGFGLISGFINKIIDMKSVRVFILFISTFSAVSLTSQQLTPFVVSSSGGFYSNSEGMLSFTTGEMTAVETYTHPLVILTQGFQQPWDLGTSITKHPLPNFSFGIYPNPTNGHFNLVTESDDDAFIAVSVFNILGSEIQKTEYYHQGKINVESFDLTYLAQGIYLVAMTIQVNGSAPRLLSIRKIHIVQ